MFGAILTGGTHGGSITSVVHGHHTVFLLTVPFAVVGFGLSLVMEENPISDEMREVTAGNIEVAEY